MRGSVAKSFSTFVLPKAQSFTTMSNNLPSLAHPGLRLAAASKYISGPGTHPYDSHIYASLAGAPTLDSSTKPPTLSIPRLLASSASSDVPSVNISVTNTLPEVGSIAIAKVTRCMVRQINVAILVVDEEVCGDEWAGVVRREDVRATEKEKVVIGESFRVGDLVRGEVVRNVPVLMSIVLVLALRTCSLRSIVTFALLIS